MPGDDLHQSITQICLPDRPAGERAFAEAFEQWDKPDTRGALPLTRSGIRLDASVLIP
jgi:hypothetical protein